MSHVKHCLGNDVAVFVTAVVGRQYRVTCACWAVILLLLSLSRILHAEEA